MTDSDLKQVLDGLLEEPSEEKVEALYEKVRGDDGKILTQVAQWLADNWNQFESTYGKFVDPTLTAELACEVLLNSTSKYVASLINDYSPYIHQ